MKRCGDCKKYNDCYKGREIYGRLSNYAEDCKNFQEKVPTNFERIKNMSIEGMADFLDELTEAACTMASNCDICPLLTDANSCQRNDIKKWLESEAKCRGMKAVLSSIKPKYCELIATGKKTWEIRKNRPEIRVPFKVYIYQSKDNWIYKILEKLKLYQQKVIGEFVCDKITPFKVSENGVVQYWNYADIYKSCLTYDEVAKYIGKNKKGYSWHISDLVIYDTPKELSEFLKYNRTEDDCYYQHLPKPNSCRECKKCVMKRPPQSWCYVEEMK